jgi:hypothetical protein
MKSSGIEEIIKQIKQRGEHIVFEHASWNVQNEFYLYATSNKHYVTALETGDKCECIKTLELTCPSNVLAENMFKIFREQSYVSGVILPIFNKRILCNGDNLKIIFGRKSDSAPDWIEAQQNFGPRIGALSLMLICSKDWFGNTVLEIPYIKASLLVSDDFFDNLTVSLRSGKRATFRFTVKEADVLVNGWNPDGSFCVNVHQLSVYV